MNLIHNKIYQRSLAILSKWLYPKINSNTEDQVLYQQCTEYWLHKIQKYVSASGINWTCKRMKLIRAYTLQYIAGTPILVSKEFLSIDKKGLPNALGPLKKLVMKGDRTSLQVLLTILSITKVLRAEPQADITSIISKSLNISNTNWNAYTSIIFNDLGIKPGSIDVTWKAFHLSVKTSPSKTVSIIESINEVSIIDTKPKLRDSIFLLGGETLKEHFIQLSHLLGDYSECKTLRRLTDFPDKEGKTRLVATLDYWSQTVLKEVHDCLLPLLKLFKSDMTYDQGGFNPTEFEGPYYSFDLKDATDRFPISLQKQVLSYLIGYEKAESWANILNSEPYDFKGRKISYEVGQPMGAYSSWCVFALSHHIVVQTAAMKVNKYPFNKYLLLGDDIMIYDCDVASMYRRLMLELGVEFSTNKTFESNVLFEFASRVFLEGKEISPFSLQGLEESMKNPATAVEFLRTMQKHGWDFLKEGYTPSQMRRLMSLSGSNAFKRWDELISIFQALPIKEVLSDLPTPEGARKYLDKLSCFEHKWKTQLRDHIHDQIITSLTEILGQFYDLKSGWVKSLPEIFHKLTRLDYERFPEVHISIPPLNVLNTFSTRTILALNNISIWKMMGGQLEFSLKVWMEMVIDLKSLPSPKTLYTRKHELQIIATSSLILKAYKRALRS